MFFLLILVTAFLVELIFSQFSSLSQFIDFFILSLLWICGSFSFFVVYFLFLDFGYFLLFQIYRQIGEKYGVEYSEDEILSRYRIAYGQPWGRSRLRYSLVFHPIFSIFLFVYGISLISILWLWKNRSFKSWHAFQSNICSWHKRPTYLHTYDMGSIWN